MLKADFHLHSSEDREDLTILYDIKQLIDHAAKLEYDVISITHHNQVRYSKELIGYAKKNGILLIPGTEATVEGRHVLVINIRPEQFKGIKTFKDLEKLKKKHNIVVIASHPFFFSGFSLGKKLLEHIKIFDGIEYAHLYTNIWNRENKIAAKVAKQHGKTLIANSDSHHLWQMGSNFTLVDSKKDISSILDAIRKGRVKISTKPLPFYKFVAVLMWAVFDI